MLLWLANLGNAGGSGPSAAVAYHAELQLWAVMDMDLEIYEQMESDFDIFSVLNMDIDTHG